MPPQTLDRPLRNNALALVRAQAACMRRGQQLGEIKMQQIAHQSHDASMAPQQPQQSGRMDPAAMYSDIAVIYDNDFYSMGQSNQQPFSIISRPRRLFFDDFKNACAQIQVAMLQHIAAQNSCTPAMLHHGLVLALSAGSVVPMNSHYAAHLLLEGA